MGKNSKDWTLKVAGKDVTEESLPENVVMNLRWPEEDGAERLKVEWEGIDVSLCPLPPKCQAHHLTHVNRSVASVSRLGQSER